jgi:uncharacterized UPF0146 family protein
VSQSHWDEVYQRLDAAKVSWYQPEPVTSLRLITSQARHDDPVIDVGGGASFLASRLVETGFTDVTVLDVSAQALEIAAKRPGVQQIRDSVLTWKPSRTYRVWHDRAVFHFLTSPADRAAYTATLRAALKDGGTLIVATFAADGPQHCSGLPVVRYDPDDLAAELGVTLQAREREEHRTPADVIQPFTWVVARIPPAPRAAGPDRA